MVGPTVSWARPWGRRGVKGWGARMGLVSKVRGEMAPGRRVVPSGPGAAGQPE